ncbi:GNAT family N-acetyltransferase [Wenxinia saemankumensis]|uniref:Protein N-acetyltransferase, RimJ/RimL family n=1 Tax=Wenxinia saemankumensis TaxID=1447782 RepID=A0A1M6AKP4_9RHOB|nr:GNAT family N-acetyltransferase [Wenxinia saemankumensis]SHI37042.1 Protein N-acetyltransferase, RimJ/RimL family [Wenxinia saemankumensis]
MIRLRRGSEADHPALLTLRSGPGQERFAGRFADWPEAARDPRYLHVIERQGRIVGLFRIDPAFDARVPGLPAGAHGVRGLLIDAASQGTGIGTAVMEGLPAHLRACHPGLRLVWLTVDHDNPGARRLYERTGWVRHLPDFAGTDGPEHVFRRELGSA